MLPDEETITGNTTADSTIEGEATETASEVDAEETGTQETGIAPATQTVSDEELFRLKEAAQDKENILGLIDGANNGDPKAIATMKAFGLAPIDQQSVQEEPKTDPLAAIRDEFGEELGGRITDLVEQKVNQILESSGINQMKQDNKTKAEREHKYQIGYALNSLEPSLPGVKKAYETDKNFRTILQIFGGLDEKDSYEIKAFKIKAAYDQLNQPKKAAEGNKNLNKIKNANSLRPEGKTETKKKMPKFRTALEKYEWRKENDPDFYKNIG